MLFSLADAGTGCYYYVDNIAAIAPCFADCLGGMLSVAAQDVTVTLRADAGVIINNVHADFNVDLSDDRTEARVKMRDLNGDVEKDVLFEMSVPSIQEHTKQSGLVTCFVSYIDVKDGVAKSQKAEMAIHRDIHGDGSRADDTVEAHRCRLLAAKAMEKAAVALGSSTDMATALSTLTAALQALEQSSARSSAEKKPREQIASLVQDLRMCLESASEPRSGEKLCSSKAFAHKHQVSTQTESVDYRNVLQQKLAEAARRELRNYNNSPDCSRASPQQRPSGHGKSARQQRSRAGIQTLPNDIASEHCGSIAAGAVRVGMRILCRDQPGKVQEVTTSKTGKHGHAKVFFVVACDDGLLRQDVCPATLDVQLAPDCVTAA